MPVEHFRIVVPDDADDRIQRLRGLEAAKARHLTTETRSEALQGVLGKHLQGERILALNRYALPWLRERGVVLDNGGLVDTIVHTGSNFHNILAAHKEFARVELGGVEYGEKLARGVLGRLFGADIERGELDVPSGMIDRVVEEINIVINGLRFRVAVRAGLAIIGFPRGIISLPRVKDVIGYKNKMGGQVEVKTLPSPQVVRLDSGNPTPERNPRSFGEDVSAKMREHIRSNSLPCGYATVAIFLGLGGGAVSASDLYRIISQRIRISFEEVTSYLRAPRFAHMLEACGMRLEVSAGADEQLYEILLARESVL